MKKGLPSIFLFYCSVFQCLFAQSAGGEYFLKSVDQGSGSMQTYVYNDLGKVELFRFLRDDNVLIEETNLYNQTSGLINSSSRDVYSFDGSGLSSERTTNYSYNSELLVEEILSINFDVSSKTTSKTKSIYSYDEIGNLTVSNSYKIDSTGLEELDARKLYAYNDDSQLESVERYLYSTEEDSLILQWGTFYTYDAQGNITSCTFSTVADDDQGSLVNYFYDENGNLISSETLFENPEYFNEIRAYVYDTSILNEQLNYPVSYSPDFVTANRYNSKLLSCKSTLIDEFGNEVTSSTLFFDWEFEKVKTNIKDEPRLLLEVWPNPTTNQLSFIGLNSSQKREVIIYDVLGKVIQVDDLLGIQNSISVSKLDAGNYIFIIVENGKKAQSGKFIKH